MNKINYSIIIPHYNVIDLLLRCMRSIPCRKDIEIIIVDDCSDNFDICKKRIEKEFSQMNIQFYFTNENSGPGVARNIGLDNAKGKWIIFEDADDFFDEDISKVFDLALDRKEDILFCHNKAVMSEDVTKLAEDYVYEDILERYSFTKNDEELRYKFYSVWGRIFKHSFLKDNNIRFENIYRAEDVLFSIKAGHLSNKLTVLPYNLNIKTAREESLSHSWKNWSEWYILFFPAHIRAMQYLHKFNSNAIDKIVYNKLLFIMKNDFNTFKLMFNKLLYRERLDYVKFLIERIPDVFLRKIGAEIK